MGHLIHHRRKSTTIKCYVSAIKAILREAGHNLNEDTALLGALTRATRLHHDVIQYRLPIRKQLLSMLIVSIERFYGDNLQPYLTKLYGAMLASGYFGLLRIGEMTFSDHTIKAKDVHIGHNKNKILFILHSSKTHGKYAHPQTVKISEIQDGSKTQDDSKKPQSKNP